MGVKCFFVEPTDRAKRSLRRYHSSSDVTSKCPGRMSYHNAHTPLDVVERCFSPGDEAYPALADPQIPHADPRWPFKCDDCDYRFIDTDPWQVFDEQIYVDKATGPRVLAPRR